MRTVGYARVSTEEQGRRGISLETQKSRLKRNGATYIYQDIESGQKSTRPGFLQMIEDAKRGSVEEIIICDVTRLGRDGVVLASTVYELKARGVKWRFLDDNIDLDDPGGTILFFLKAGMSQSEVEKTKHRVKTSFKKLKEKGLPIGTLPYGYILDSLTRKAVIDEIPLLCLISDRPSNWDTPDSKEFYQELYSSNTEYYNFHTHEYINWKSLKNDTRLKSITIADLCRESIDTYIKVKCFRQVCNYFKDKYNLSGIRKGSMKETPRRYMFPFNNLTSFSRWIRNPVLYGHIHYKKEGNKRRDLLRGRIADFTTWAEEYEIKFDSHQRLISKEQEKMLYLISSPRQSLSSKPDKIHSKTDVLFSGLLFCPACKHHLTHRKSAGKSGFNYYFCRTTGCSNTNAIREDNLNKQVINEILNKTQSGQIEDHEKPSKPLEICRLEEEISELDKTLILHPNNQIFIKAKEDSLKKLSELENGYKCFDFYNKSAAEILNHPAMRNIGFLEFLSLEHRKIIYRNLIEFICIQNGKVDFISYNL
ncbi:resolvase domain-containing protein (plasmid) [Calothrix sp. NIES-4071]|nr:resolvase domain-containing protein [Calothrix sp. NIES-4071]BAZ65258.1 resolvase domain-containing protein [Calothrix sp. NIES-4105]